MDDDDELSWELFDNLLEDAKEGDDVGGVIYGVFINLVHFLADIGWTKEELLKDVEWHVENQNSDGLA